MVREQYRDTVTSTILDVVLPFMTQDKVKASTCTEPWALLPPAVKDPGQGGATVQHVVHACFLTHHRTRGTRDGHSFQILPAKIGPRAST